jgi:thiol-disulfide isomerase/thioredoxin
MRQLRNWVPVLGILALAALFLKLPETPEVLRVLACKTCSSSEPYLPLIGAGYFAILVTVSFLFPAFPGPQVARGGLIWAVLLAAALTYLNRPGVCPLCLIGHACHILIWIIWNFAPPAANESRTSAFRERLCLTLFAPISVVALFSGLNLTFMAYGFKFNHSILASSLQPGDALPAFTAETTTGRSLTNTSAAATAGIVINFVSPGCPYCEQQLPVLNTVAAQLAKGSYRFINISPAAPPDLLQRAPATEWVEDKEGALRELFQVSGYPTLFVVGTNGKIVQVIPGFTDQLQSYLLTDLLKPPAH